MTVIDVHTHMFTAKWLELLKKDGGLYSIKTRPDGQQEIFRGDTPVVIPQRGHFDYAAAKAGLAGLLLTLKNEIVQIDPFGRVNPVNRCAASNPNEVFPLIQSDTCARSPRVS